MKFALIALGLLATTGVVYAACVFCWQKCSRDEKARLSAGPFCFPPSRQGGLSRLMTEVSSGSPGKRRMTAASQTAKQLTAWDFSNPFWD